MLTISECRLQPFKMVNEQTKSSIPRQPLIHMLHSDKMARVSEETPRLSPRLMRLRDSATSDFAAYYHSSPVTCDPAFSVTSHHTRDLPQPRMLLHTYPCSAITWNPYVQTSSVEDGYDWKDTRCVRPDRKFEFDCKRYDDNADKSPFHCRCAHCTDKSCPGNYYPTFKPPTPAYKTTIMTFRDQCTMTLKLNEAATTVTPVPSCRGSDESDACCDYAVRDMPARTYTHDCGKPILKNRNDCCKDHVDLHNGLPPLLRDPLPPCSENSSRYYPSPPESCSPERDKDRKDEHLTETSLLSSIFKFRKKKDQPLTHCPRRALYNEGISDRRAGNMSPTCSLGPQRIPSPTNMLKLRNKVSAKSKCCINESKSGIPYSHRTDSKFHHDCVNSAGPGSSELPAPRRVVASSRFNKAATPSNYQAIQFIPPARNPRKLLTSEKNVDSYVEGPTYGSAMKRRPKRN